MTGRLSPHKARSADEPVDAALYNLPAHATRGQLWILATHRASGQRSVAASERREVSRQMRKEQQTDDSEGQISQECEHWSA